MRGQRERTLRVVVVGDSEVGKTSLIQKYTRGSFDVHQKNTIGAVFHTQERDVNGKTVVMQIWDTAGQEKYRSLGPIYYRDARAGIAVFDVTSSESLPALERWIADFRKHTEDPALFIVGNKCDLVEDRIVTENDACDFAKQNDADIFFTSAKTGDGVKELFEAVFEKLISMTVREAENENVPIGKTPPEKSKCTCC